MRVFPWVAASRAAVRVLGETLEYTADAVGYANCTPVHIRHTCMGRKERGRLHSHPIRLHSVLGYYVSESILNGTPLCQYEAQTKRVPCARFLYSAYLEHSLNARCVQAPETVIFM